MVKLDKIDTKWTSMDETENDVWIVVESTHPNVRVYNFILDDASNKTTTDMIENHITSNPDGRFEFLYDIKEPMSKDMESFFKEILRDKKIELLIK